MKKILPVLFCFLFFKSQAVIQNVSVSSFQFTPATFTVTVGDVVHFIWVNGGHTTTSLTVPAGAATWNAVLNGSAGNTTFDYTVTQAGNYSFQCNIHPGSMQGTFTASGPTPVILSAFNVSSHNNKPYLSWTTQTENNSDYFSVRESINGTDFNEVGRVPAAGNSLQEKNYSFSDFNIESSIKYAYYFLAIVDKDGKTGLSQTKLFKNKLATTKLITSLSPNPVSNAQSLMIKFNADKTTFMNVTVLDIAGQIVKKATFSAFEGINNGHIHLEGLAAGVYTISFSLDGMNEAYKIEKK
ncbi:MAG: T9SS type A sorting domain-containing protein [Chitinophagaceae bacterium]|nr:T9SS type A sorting domain-containing protein [Chitinophagaceae bacterium]